MDYYTFWSISDLPSNTIKPFQIFFTIIIISLLLWILIKKYKKRGEDYEKSILLWTIGILFCLSVIMFSYFKFFAKDNSDKRIQDIFRSSKTLVIEGRISNFKSIHPTNRKGNIIIESFEVDTINFQYGDELLSRFNHFSKTNNGVFRNNLPVRITYSKINNEILKVEIAK